MVGHLAHDKVADIRVARAQGSYLTDERGKRYIDFIMGWCAGNLGWGQRAASAARRFRGPDYVYPGFRYRPWEDLSRLVVSMAPGRLEVCFRATGGSEAVDLALQAAMAHTGRRGFLSLEDSYHGN